MKPRPHASALVLDAETRQALAATRSLGRAGVDVRAAVTLVSAPRALASSSRWCHALTQLPDLDDAGAFADAVVAALDHRPADVLFPLYDGSIEAVRLRRSEIEARTAVALASDAALTIAVDKPLTLALAERLGIAVPRRISPSAGVSVADALAHTGLPAVIKPHRSWGNGVRRASALATTVAEAERLIELFATLGVDVEIQQWLCGRRDAVTLLSDGSDLKFSFAQASHRELPPLGGVSVLCESIEPLEDIVKPAQRLVLEMGLTGCSLVEFRRDAYGSPVLMEVNARMPGSVALAVGCGVDVPLLTLMWARGEHVEPITNYVVGRRLRWLVGDVWSLYSVFNDEPGPDVPSRRRAVAEFMSDFARPGLRSTFALDDPRPSWVEARTNVLHPLGDRLARVLWNRPSHTPRAW